MINTSKRKLTLAYTLLYFLLFSAFAAVLYGSLYYVMVQQQKNQLETFYTEQQHDFFTYLQLPESYLTYDPNRHYFYYIYDKEGTFIHGDESVKDLQPVLYQQFLSIPINQEKFLRTAWEGQHFITLQKPIYDKQTLVGYLFVGQTTTAQTHFFTTMGYVFIALTLLSTLLIALLSYYLATKAMTPLAMALSKQKRFVSDASHELRTPLTIFYSSLDILALEAKSLSPFGQQLIDELQEEATFMEQLLLQLLLLAKLDQSEDAPAFKRVDFSALAMITSQKFAKRMPANLTFSTAITPQLYCNGDEIRLRELLYILLDNAIAYTPKGSIYFSVEAAHNTIVVTITDSGIGIAAGEVDAIFGRFYRTNHTAKQTGNGLGLAIAKAITLQHQGTISVSSTVGKGSTFTVILPKQS
ncbi:MAG TPA: HAMP domain-containing histidine kinase [Metalysinibacillus jejuensis]|uniref:histidine kinase n=1 Tax=Metalysinibacillus jejuensis TaxID=914327 RepID=A0A921ND22_9BACL|nr:HAMP domain-containing histidine kinase [Metalysinibacillus jejuensis]